MERRQGKNCETERGRFQIVTSLFQQIDELIPTLHGWASVEKAVSLASYTLAVKPKVCVEIGTWGGRSAVPILLALKEVGSGKLTCIDPWSPDESTKGQTTEIDKEWWGSVANHELVYQHFQYTVDKFGLRPYCETQRISSEEAHAPPIIDLCHIDGNHGPQAYTDTVKFASNVRQWGICVLDDLDWVGGHVRRAEKWLLENGFIMLHPLGTGAVYLKTK